MPGYGEAFQTQAEQRERQPGQIRGSDHLRGARGYAICAYAAGPQVDLNRVVNHPTQSKLALALWADPDINGVRWKGQAFP